MTRTRTQYAVLNMASNFAGYFINTVVGFFCRMVFVRCLTAEHLGVAGLFTNIIMMLSLSELGLGAVMTHALYEPIAKDNKEKIAALTGYFAKIFRVISGFIIIAGIALLPFLDHLVKERPVIDESFTLIYLLFVFNCAFSYLFSHYILFVQASQKQYVLATVCYITTIVQSCIQILFLLLTKNYVHYLVIQVVCSLFQFLFIAQWVRRKNRYLFEKPVAGTLDKQEKRTLFKNVWRLSLGKLSGFLVNGTDNIIISKLIGIASVGLLSNYVLLTRTVDGVVNNLMLSIGAGIGNFNALSDKKSTAQLFHNISFIVFAVYGVTSVILYACANDLIRLLFGERYVMSQGVCALLVLNSFMLGLINLVGTFMNATGVFERGRLVVIITAFLNIGLSIWFGINWGILGVLAATAVARLVTNWWYQPWALLKCGLKTGCTKYFLNYGVFIVVSILAVLLGGVVVSLMDSGHFVIILLLKAVVPAVFFLTGIYMIYRTSLEMKYCVEKLKQLQASLMARMRA